MAKGILAKLPTAKYEVMVVPSGAALVALLSKPFPPCVVLLNTTLSDITGYGAVRHVRQLGHAKRVPIIAYAPVLNDLTITKMARHGIDDQLSTPIQLSTLEPKLVRWWRALFSDELDASTNHNVPRFPANFVAQQLRKGMILPGEESRLGSDMELTKQAVFSMNLIQSVASLRLTTQFAEFAEDEFADTAPLPLSSMMANMRM